MAGKTFLAYWHIRLKTTKIHSAPHACEQNTRSAERIIACWPALEQMQRRCPGYRCLLVGQQRRQQAVYMLGTNLFEGGNTPQNRQSNNRQCQWNQIYMGHAETQAHQRTPGEFHCRRKCKGWTRLLSPVHRSLHMCCKHQHGSQKHRQAYQVVPRRKY